MWARKYFACLIMHRILRLNNHDFLEGLIDWLLYIYTLYMYMAYVALFINISSLS